MQSTEYFTVSSQDIEHFRTNGFVKLEKIIRPEQIAEFRKQMNKSIDEVSLSGDKQKRIDDYSQIFTQVTNIWRVNPACSNFILKKSFGHIVKQLLGIEHVRLYHDQALVKNPKAGKTPWHQDYFYWPIDFKNTVTMWLPLHDCPKQMGTMKFVCGSHKAQNIKMMGISEDSEAYFSKIIEQQNLIVKSYDLNAGDATFHYGRTLHCANPNGKSGKREVITIIFFDDGAKVIPKQQFNEFRKVDLEVFCPKMASGDVIESQLNPIII